MTKSILKLVSLALMLLIPAGLSAQGLTTASINGTVMDSKGTPLPGANIVALHVPSGTIFGAASRNDGSFNVTGMRVGGHIR